jgi:hypothetical protein
VTREQTYDRRYRDGRGEACNEALQFRARFLVLLLLVALSLFSLERCDLHLM